ncbi:hypothetical protein DTO027I6_4396 [Penicillium roqueforti]|uniref:uncharacterized protein n=1 Tax=Penicillium roqueforti TaxID=5082 RepID=UPI00190BE3B4|nr:uncharacterized protein LCP9604111_4145 [Penicillium roqueforti]KAF9249516.1 hypothetical protein LCP9604111_4145 [Penicillium roqueforti]KAI2677070.1 hypothetical protein CBS147355_5297 [Penicillium roqueforti]KAI2688632.1 hypothetical protein LCP963914a_3034 [Penicillium roqueforti]KAI2700809.1 hypothetical protein CBS147372_5588 [Penicillium roqueforti]KAI2720211.1 hypothetical protein CBS147318_3517 [Penicillium roqueforti]
MRFSIAALALGATGAMAGVVTETLTEYTTYCPEATSIVHGSHTYSISTPGYITMSHGPYTVTRPISTSTVTECNSCSSTAVVSTPVASAPVASAPAPSAPVVSTPLASSPVASSSTPLIPVVPSVVTSTPLVPTAGSTGVPSVPSSPSSAPSSPSSAVTPSQPAFNTGAMNAATGAGAGLAAILGAVALLL